MKSFAQSLLALWRQLGINQRVSLILAALVVVAVLAGLVAWARKPDYQLLYGRLGEKDASAVISTLQEMGVPHRIAAGGSAVYVPSTDVHRMRMELAGKGLPGGEGVGFEIFDKGQFGLSDFVQRTNYTRALQGELSRTISQFEGVARARVMIVQPENRLLLTDQGIKPTASVFVELSAPRLGAEAVDSIRNLVANAVQGLVPDQVAVVDQKGRVLSAELKDDPALSNASSQIKYRQEVESYFAGKVQSMLESVVGAGNVVVRVSADIDTDQATLVEERFDPDSQVVRTQTNTEDVTNSQEARVGGVVGASANTGAPPDAEADRPVVSNDQTRKSRTTSYEINRTLTNTTRNPGRVRGLTAAVFLAQRTGGGAAARNTEELAGLRAIVVRALGLRPEAGRSVDDMVALQEVPFNAPVPSDLAGEAEGEAGLQRWFDIGSRYVPVGLALLVLLIFVWLLRRQRVEPVMLEALPGPAAAEAAAAPAPAEKITPEMLNELIKQKPAQVGAVLREWMASKKN
ncbi:flagellar basal-body MS-ring/collar protein FliF [Termitidicoccus mucosus]|uniref:Flagellar M-ring protein n=1 Tax=Termitidicoccus mucosus TaxID=1184151 RepID=A0A178IFW8_9BACT|nr:flagellar M-ring protein FliF [Opitutaceae bacterium TSB47]